MERALKFIRTPVKFAAARYFYAQGWISKQTLQENLPSSRRNNEPESDPLYFEDENMSTTDEYKNQDLPSDEACMNDALSL
ncbi:hypothetical protein G6F46_015715 [Rhizopus delemar]|uniref:Uncharacterized protein n=1 Tax=Rhizopus oryzae TaxID=64495 RepID=A0A9P6XKX6_RHIOR|nr:hypothetical protein G6F51_014729 [Rhizopus arrhizus]KAG1564407.1 hypothetical protein G6F47_013913 [Rhizopus delemar]KAG1579031.1 hypothetical protein G6F46_015715 [Rhizopus delemar]KAG1615868.1 hypothetical protein G6F44_013160 [Rhizopus delemar]